MFKKVLTIILVITIIATMWIVPVKANSEIELPTGEFYTLEASEVEPFKAGDTITIRLTVSDVKDDWSLMGVDITVPFNNEILEYVSADSSSEIINADYPDGEVKWELIINKNNAADGKLLITMLDDGDGWLGTSTDGAIWVELTFTALKDTVGGEYLLHTAYAEGTENVDLETAYGDGVAVYVEGGDSIVPTEAPATQKPTEEPSPIPTVAPTKIPFDATNPLVDVDFTTAEDTKGNLIYIETENSGYKYGGDVIINDQFAIEFYGTFKPGTMVLNHSAYQLEAYYGTGMLESWWTKDPSVACISTADVDFTVPHHVVLVGNVDTYTMYIDGEAVATQSGVSLVSDVQFVGGDNLMWVNGNLSLFRIYGAAPDVDQIAALYEQALTTKTTPAPFDATNPLIDINYDVSIDDKKGVLVWEDNEIGNRYTGSLELTNEFTFEIMGTFGPGCPMYATKYMLEIYNGGFVESWYTGLNKPYVSTYGLDLTKEHHIVLTADGSAYRMYIDGVLAAEDIGSVIPESFNLNGGNRCIAIGHGASDMKLFRVYGTSASAEDVASLYEAASYVKDEKVLPIFAKPYKTFYKSGETLEFDGLVTGIWNEDKTEYTDVTEDTIINAHKIDTTVGGSYKVEVVYETNDTIYRNTFTIHVTEPVVTGIGIVTKPSKTFYTVGEEFDASGLVLLVKYSDGTIDYLYGSDVAITGYDMTKASDYLVSAEYEGKVAQFTVHVKEAAPVTVTGVGIVTKPSKTVYAVGEEFDPTGLKILVKYSNGTVEYLEGADVPVAGFDSSVANSFLVKIAVEGKVAQFTIHIR